MKPHEPHAGDFRVTIPIPSAAIMGEDGYFVESPFRRVLHPGYEVVVLDSREQRRLEEGPYRIHTACRLEIFDAIDTSKFDPWSGEGHEQVDRLVTSTLGKLSLCVRDEFSGEFIVVDRFDGSVWRRFTNVDSSDRSHGSRYARIPVDRLDTWGALIANWPTTPDALLDSSLNYYRESVSHRRAGRRASAMVSAAIATEILFGGGNSELTYRISTRCAQLLARGDDALRVQRAVKKLYGHRSRVVHSGKAVSEEQLDLWHQLLMASIPAVAAWPGSVESLRSALDEASFIRSEGLDSLQAKGSWWGFCNFAECLHGSVLDAASG